MSSAWPVRLEDGELGLRPLAVSDAREWQRARKRNAACLIPWDATVPPGGDARPTRVRSLVRRLERLGDQVELPGHREGHEDQCAGVHATEVRSAAPRRKGGGSVCRELPVGPV